MKPSNKTLRKLMREEKQSAKRYRRYGYKKLSKDERSHSKFLREQLK